MATVPPTFPPTSPNEFPRLSNDSSLLMLPMQLLTRIQSLLSSWRQEDPEADATGTIARFRNTACDYLPHGALQCLVNLTKVPGTERFLPIKRISLLHKDWVVVTNPKMIREVLREIKNGASDEAHYVGGPEFENLAAGIGHHTILTALEEEHHILRSFAVKHQFGTSNLRRGIQSLSQLGEKFIQGLGSTSSAPANMSLAASDFVAAALSQMILGPENTNPEVAVAVRRLDKVLSDMMLRKPRLPLAWNFDYQYSMASLREAVAQVKKNSSSTGLISDMIIAVNDDGSASFNEEQIIGMCLLIFFVGQGTTSSAITSAIYHLIQNPEWQQRLREEAKKVLGNSPLTSSQELEKLEELNCFMKEVIRLNPPVWVQPRTVSQAVQVDDMVIEEGVTILLAHYLSQRCASEWGPDAGEFKPMRFAREKGAKYQPKNWAPFGWGANRCVGEFFARYAIRIFVHHLVMSFDVAGANDQPLEHRGGFSLRFSEEVKSWLTPRNSVA